MHKLFILITLFVLAFFSCKKEEILEDPEVYYWKVDLYQRLSLNERVHKDSVDKTLLVQTEYFHLTKKEVKEMQRKKPNNGLMQYFTYTKIEEN